MRWCVIGKHRSLAAAVLILGASLLVGCAGGAAAAPPAPTVDAATEKRMIDEAANQAWGEVQRMFPDAERPQVEQVRVVTAADSAKVVAQCIQELGYPATAREDGGISFGATPEAQAEQQNIAVYTCRVKYPTDPAFTLPPTDDEIAYLYDYYANTLVPCLAERGYDIEMPSKGAFVDSTNVNGIPWSPYQDLASVGGGELDALLLECKQTPHGFRGGE